MVSYEELQKFRLSYNEQNRKEYPMIRQVVKESAKRIFDIFSELAFVRFELEIIDEIEQNENLSEKEQQELIAKVKQIVSQYNQKML